MNDLILAVKDLTISFPDEDNDNKRKQVVRNLSFNLKKGEILGIVGESGSGKSLTSLAIMGLIPSSGQIDEESEINYYFNHDLNKFNLAEKEKQNLGISEGKDHLNLLTLTNSQKTRYRGGIISMIFQEPMSAFNPVYTIGFQLTEAIELHQKMSPAEKKIKPKDKAKNRAITLLEDVQLPEPAKLLKKYPHELSGGQLQRVMIAMALSCNPRILIADEPTTALDVTTQKEILKVLKEVQAKPDNKDLSIIFISHDLGVINEISDRVLVMYQGEKQEELTTEKSDTLVTQKHLFEHLANPPQEAYTKGLLACLPRLNKKLKRLPTVKDYLDENKEQNRQEVLSSDEITLEEEKSQLEKIIKRGLILSVKDLSVTYGKAGFFGNKEGKQAVEKVSFEVYRGETLGIVGESGCGKSTLARAILRLISSKGVINFYPNPNDKKPEHLSTYKTGSEDLQALRKKIQIVFQNPYNSLNPRMTIGAAIIEPMIIHNMFNHENEEKSNEKPRKNSKKKKDRKRIERAIRLLGDVGLGKKVPKDASNLDPKDNPYFNRYPHELSGGQRQRVCIARALALEPSLIICDESVSALDVSVQAEVLNLLKELQEEKQLTYLFISHDLSVVRFMSDRIMVMKDGKTVERTKEQDSVRPSYEIIQRDNISDYTQKLLDAIPAFPEDKFN
ncbi:MAG: ATP-binding cassette domain-containing protein [Microcystaceae cyanobacterium]